MTLDPRKAVGLAVLAKTVGAMLGPDVGRSVPPFTFVKDAVGFADPVGQLAHVLAQYARNCK